MKDCRIFMELDIGKETSKLYMKNPHKEDELNTMENSTYFAQIYKRANPKPRYYVENVITGEIKEV